MYLMLLPVSSSLVLKGFRSLGMLSMSLSGHETMSSWPWQRLSHKLLGISLILVFLQLLLRVEKLGTGDALEGGSFKEPSCLFSCEGAALEVLMSVCVWSSWNFQVPEGPWRFQRVPEGPRRFLKVPECPWRLKVQGMNFYLFESFVLSSSQGLHSACFHLHWNSLVLFHIYKALWILDLKCSC